jgi:hypothetical protein
LDKEWDYLRSVTTDQTCCDWSIESISILV